MISVEYILLMSTGISFVILIVLLFLSRHKTHKPENIGKPLSKDMRKIKQQISEDID